MYEFHRNLSMQVVIRSNNSAELDFFYTRDLLKEINQNSQRKVLGNRFLLQKMEQDKIKAIEGESNVPKIKDEQDFNNLADESEHKTVDAIQND